MPREWIAVTDRLPENGQRVEVWLNHLERANYCRFYLSDDPDEIGAQNCYSTSGNKITHWRPEPDPPTLPIIHNSDIPPRFKIGKAMRSHNTVS